jgi:tRNA-2-methylthio-N6-dimethylallyladenosine synthase
VNYAQAYSFKYSPRPGTPAAAMEDQLPRDIMDERLQRLQALLNQQQLGFNSSSIGRRTDVLLERPGKKPGQMIGKTPWLQSVHVETGAGIGEMVAVEIVSAGPNSLAGTVIPAKAGTSGREVSTGLPEVPASAGMTVAGRPEAPAFAGVTG